MKKRISIITYSRAYNYGSALQTFALNYYLRSLENEVKTIDYTTRRQQELYSIFESCNGLFPLLRNIHSLINIFKLYKHKRNFDEFLNTNVPMTQKITDDNSFLSLNNDFDYFICGSDQIWNVQCDDFDSNYMLSFVKDKNRCIAYAPSLGAGADNNNVKDVIRKYASCFKALSSREVKSADVIEAATQKKVTNVLDPVFLLSSDEWTKVSSNLVIKENYILGYFIGDVKGMRDFASHLSDFMGMPVVVIYKNLRDLKYNFKNYYEAGPAEFVSLVKNAKFIVTNSFHAVSFSLIFKKNFWVFTETGTSDTRIPGLLADVNLCNRIIKNDYPENVIEPIPYESQDFSILEEKINISKKFLIDNIN